MHRLRKELLIRLVLVLLALVGVGYYGFVTADHSVSRAAGLRARPFRVENVALPAENTKDLIAMGVSLVEETGKVGEVSYLVPSLVEKKEGRVETARLTLIAQGQKERYAMINDRIYRVGDTLPDGRRVRALNGDGVLLSALGQSELLPWLPPLKVDLEKSAPAPAAGDSEVKKETVVENPVETQVENKGEKVVLNADKAMQLLKQLEALGAGK